MRVAIIGSGFGGSIAALRFRQKGWDVDVYELGEEWPSTKMRQTQDTRYLYRVMRDYPADFYSRTDTLRPKLVVAQGMGVGGGSLVYSGIHLRAPTNALTSWPVGWQRTDLDYYYGKVETNLSVQQYLRSAGFDFPKRQVFAQGASLAGYPTPVANPLAMAGCTMCGWCVPNCIFDKKQSMPLTYLGRARTAGARVFSQVKAMRIDRVSGKYRVIWLSTAGRRDNYHTVNTGTLSYYTGCDADKVVIACGAMESPALLQRSIGSGSSQLAPVSADASNWLGRQIDGSGDAVVGGIVPQTTDSFKGAIMMDNIEMANGEYVLEDISSIPAGVGVKYPASFPSIPGSPLWGMQFKQKTRNFSKKMLAIAVMGKQGGGTGGNITVTNDNGIAVVSGTAYQPPTGSIAAAKLIITRLGGEVADTPYERDGTIATVHPTGGCAMGHVVDSSTLALSNNSNVHVIDGSVFPSGCWRNPSHTISAVAEKALVNLLGNPPVW